MPNSKNGFDWIKNIKWVKMKERDIDIALESFYTKGYKKEYFKKIGINFGIGNQLVFSDGRIFFDQEDIDKANELIAKKNKLSEYTLKITNDCIKQLTRFEDFLKKYEKTNFNKISDNALKKIYSEFVETVYGIIPQAFIISEILEKIASERILRLLQSLTSDPVSLYAKLTIPTRSSALSQEYVARLSLASKLQQNKAIGKEIRKHLNKFGWVSLYSPMDNLLTEEKFLVELRKISERPNLIDELKQAKNKETELKNISAKAWQMVTLPSQDRRLIKVMQKNAWARTYRRELMSQSFFQMRSMYIVCSQKLGLEFPDLRQIACWEIAEYLGGSKKISRQQIKERSLGYIFLQQKDKVKIISGQLMRQIFDPEKHVIPSTELNGLPVYHGYAVGPVKLIHKREELVEFKKGDVLVAPTVGTWMMPAVEKCSAIITDAGGVLSHTAIVAREFHKPCIVATKNATKILKNGQIITVDTKRNTITLN